MTMQLNIDTKPLLRTVQLEAAREERDGLEKKLHSPHIQDKGEVARQIRRLDLTLASQTPKAFVGAEKDEAVRMEAELRSTWLDGMLSQEEMRKNPPGAVDRHIEWMRRTKQAQLQWKNLVLRMNVGNPDASVTNMEKHRPTTSTMNMDGAQIAGKQFFMPPDGAGPAVAFTDAQIELLRAVAPDAADKLALLTNAQRAQVKAALAAEPVDDSPL